MIYSLSELREKEVISLSDGEKLGFVDDMEFDAESSALTSLVIWGRPRLFGLFGRGEDMIIPVTRISLIGKDTILITGKERTYSTKTKKISLKTLYE